MDFNKYLAWEEFSTCDIALKRLKLTPKLLVKIVCFFLTAITKR